MERLVRDETRIKAWRDTDQNCHYYYRIENGLIVGQVHNLAHTKIWVAKILYASGEESYIGQYINVEFAKNAIEHHWAIEERTLIE